MKPGSEEWFREEAEKIAHPYGPDTCVVIESALRRVFNAACEEDAKIAMSRAEALRAGRGVLVLHEAIQSRWSEATLIARDIRAMKVSA